MNTKYKNMFKALVSAYYNGNFENYVNGILSDPHINKNELSSVISALCGVEVEFNDNENYAEELKKAILSDKKSTTVINKIRECSMECADESGQTICQKSCPFDAILVDKKKALSYIDNDNCTSCGVCADSCPSGSIIDKVEFMPLIKLLKGDSTVVAAVAPAIAGQFGEKVSLDMLREAFIKIGFTDMVEVAFFADMLTLKEAIEFDEHVHKENDILITSCCCPMWVGMLKKVYYDLVKHVSPSVSPMIAAGRVLKKLNPSCKVVFIGPCIAKKAESKEKDLLGDIDFVLTFSEVKDIFEALNVNPKLLTGIPSTQYASREGRLYARSGGVSTSVNEAVARLFPEKEKLFSSIQVSGVKECKNILEKLQNGEADANFIEGMGCVGGCVGGPKALLSKEDGKKSVDETAEASEIRISLDSAKIRDMLEKLGINSACDFKDKAKTELFERHF